MVEKKGGLRYRGIVVLLAGFLLLTAGLLGREFWRTWLSRREPVLTLLDEAQWEQLCTQDQAQWAPVECLLIGDGSAQGLQAEEMMTVVLEQMKIGFDRVDAACLDPEQLDGYATAVLAVTDLTSMGGAVADLMDWVGDGGGLLLLYAPSGGAYLDMLSPMLGIRSYGSAMVQTDALRFTGALMPGGEGVFPLEGGYPATLPVQLTADCTVYLETDGEYPAPLLWRRTLDQGTVAVVNLGYTGKMFRGIYAAAYSLLGEGAAWPVINGAAYLIDDFPSPTPNGNLEYIQRDYGETEDIEHFISEIWWPDLADVAKTYSVRYTGAVIEQYYDLVDGTVVRNHDYARYELLGNGLLNTGGELAYHGYNQAPLMLESIGWNQPWTDTDAMASAMAELAAFCREIFPRELISTYIPPSNMLSEEGRRMLAERFPEIRAICGVYLPGEHLCVQEYGVGEDGIVELPWATQGFLFSGNTRLTSLSELMFHYAGEHFLHLDELLDFADETQLGWPEMRQRLEQYIQWQQAAAPGLRQMTASELAGAVQRYDAVTVRRIWQEDRLVLELGDFADEAWLLVRLNGRRAGQTVGGTLEELLDGLYLLKAESGRVEITLE